MEWDNTPSNGRDDEHGIETDSLSQGVGSQAMELDPVGNALASPETEAHAEDESPTNVKQVQYHVHQGKKWAFHKRPYSTPKPYTCVYNCTKVYASLSGIYKHLEGNAHVDPAQVLPMYAYKL